MTRTILFALTFFAAQAALAGSPPDGAVPAVPEPVGAAVFAAGAVVVSLALRNRKR